VRRVPLLAIVLAFVGTLDVLSAGPASSVELRDAELIAGGSPVLRNDTGAVRLEDSRFSRLGALAFVREPGTL
jgi:hypothetical protein